MTTWPHFSKRHRNYVVLRNYYVDSGYLWQKSLRPQTRVTMLKVVTGYLWQEPRSSRLSCPWPGPEPATCWMAWWWRCVWEPGRVGLCHISNIIYNIIIYHISLHSYDLTYLPQSAGLAVPQWYLGCTGRATPRAPAPGVGPSCECRYVGESRELRPTK